MTARALTLPELDLPAAAPCRPGAAIGLLLSRQPRFVHPESHWLHSTKVALHWIADRGGQVLAGSGHAAWEFVHWYARRLGLPMTMFDAGHLDELLRAADAFLALSIRPSGLMMRLARDALAAGKSVHALPGNGVALPAHRAAARAEPAGAVTLPPSCPGSLEGYLWHYTRSRAGPWPGQTRDEWFEALADGRKDATHTAAHALLRIVTEKRIRSGSHLVRGAASVVSLSARPPDVLCALRHYRCWLGRWDYEPWAVGIRREAARGMGARPVHYLPSSAYAMLATGERWRFQKHEPPETDWSHEEEWRILGDIDLSRLTPDDWVVYHHPP